LFFGAPVSGIDMKRENSAPRGGWCKERDHDGEAVVFSQRPFEFREADR
jgi:hypothetical protein